MKSIAARVLAAMAIFEGIAIIWLIVTGAHYVVRKQISPIPADSPISLAVKYDAPDKTFEKVVQQNLGWLSYRPTDQVLAILPKCACERRTNYVRILIQNGADVDEAVKQLMKVRQEAAVKLVKQIEVEVNHNQ
jgi:hypothetical protein